MKPHASTAVLSLLLASLAGAEEKAAPRPAGRDSAIRELVQVEHDFAALAVKENWRDAFLAYFADDGVWFTPGPSRTKEALSKIKPRAIDDKVEWFPTRTCVSLAGDLGFNTGPYRWTDPRPNSIVRHGHFFTIWKRQPDGHWKAALDFGAKAVSAPTETERDWRALPATGYEPPAAGKAPADGDLKAQEEAFTASIREEGLASAYRHRLDTEGTLLREENPPRRGPAAVGGYLAAQTSVKTIAFSPEYAALARSGDLGYTYGRYAATDSVGDEVEQGYYAHVWRRDAKGEWKLVFDVASAPPETSAPKPPAARPTPAKK